MENRQSYVRLVRNSEDGSSISVSVSSTRPIFVDFLTEMGELCDGHRRVSFHRIVTLQISYSSTKSILHRLLFKLRLIN